ncbi:MAG TPA: SIMPL domain-containing protein [Polyangiaceae bacterium]
MTTNDAKRQALGLVQSAVLGIAMVAGLGLIGNALVDAVRIRQKEQRITVTGSATRRIRSDFIVWEATVRSQDPALTAAYKKLATDVPVVVDFVKAHGIKPEDITVLSTSVQEVHPRNEQGMERPEVVAAYITEQVVKVKSAEIPKVEQVSREATQLIDRGIYIHSDAPLYIYTKLAELKIKMLAEASADAKLRAEQIAINTGSRLAGLLNARMGVLQVNPEFSTEVSWDGNNDKTTLDKDVLAIVTASFAVR